MNSEEEFENRARLYVLGALDDEELKDFEAQRRALGQAAERTIQECERLNSIFALSLRPTPPQPTTKQRLLEMIKSAHPTRGSPKDH
jgi:hypothetical protein